MIHFNSMKLENVIQSCLRPNVLPDPQDEDEQYSQQQGQQNQPHDVLNVKIV